MAAYCKQCSMAIFREDWREFAGLLPKRIDEHTEIDAQGIVVFCGGCDWTIVDRDGVCISPDCLLRHGKEEECQE